MYRYVIKKASIIAFIYAIKNNNTMTVIAITYQTIFDSITFSHIAT
ncbi:MAG: hypothetical protein WCG25_06450 [bacterium]